MLNLMQVTCDKLVEEFGTLAQEKSALMSEKSLEKYAVVITIYSQNRK